MLYFWSFFRFVFLVVNCILTKISSKKVEEKRNNGYVGFLIVTGVCACIFFFVIGGFQVHLNQLTAIYSIVYAIDVLVINIFLLKVYQLTTVANVNVIISAGGLVITSAMGCLIFQEKVTFIMLLRIGIMLVAVFLVFWDLKKDEESADEKKKRKLLLFMLVVVVLVTALCCSTIIMKFYANAGEKVVDNNSFFFFTNLFMLLGAWIWFVAERVGRSRDKVQHTKIDNILEIGVFFVFVGGAVSSNLISLTELQLVDLLDVSVFTPVSSALGIIASGIATFLCREKLGKYSIMAMCISVIVFFI